MPKEANVSVVIPFLNRSKFLDRTIRSIINQIKTPAQVILVDNGSTQKEYRSCAAILKKYQNHLPRIELISTRNTGNANLARELGLELAKHKYVAFLDSDDWWEKEHLEIALQTINATNKAAYYCGATIHESYKKVVRTTDVNNFRTPFEFLTSGNIAQTSSFVIDKTKLPQGLTIWDPKLRRHQDYDFFLTIYFNTDGWCTSGEALTNIDWEEGGSKSNIDIRSMIRFILKWEDMMDDAILVNFLSIRLKEIHTLNANKMYINYYKKKILSNPNTTSLRKIKLITKPILLSHAKKIIKRYKFIHKLLLNTQNQNHR